MMFESMPFTLLHPLTFYLTFNFFKQIRMLNVRRQGVTAFSNLEYEILLDVYELLQ